MLQRFSISLKKTFLFFIAINFFITSILYSMELTTKDYPLTPHTSTIINALNIARSDKTTDFESYCSKMGKIANLILIACKVDKNLYKIKTHHDICKTTESYAFHENKFIAKIKQFVRIAYNDNNTITKEYDSCTDKLTEQTPTINTSLGSLIDHDKDTYYLLLKSSDARALHWKIERRYLELGKKKKELTFLQQYLNDNTNEIKIVANQYTYRMCNRECLFYATRCIRTKSNLTTLFMQDYLQSIQLKDIFAKEIILLSIASTAQDKADETVPSIIKTLAPFCLIPDLTTLPERITTLKKIYLDIINEISEEIFNHVPNNNNNHHAKCNNYLKKYFSYNEYTQLFIWKYNYERTVRTDKTGLLPNVTLFEPRKNQLIHNLKPIRPTTSKTKKKKNRAQKATQEINTEIKISNSSDFSPQKTDNSTPETTITPLIEDVNEPINNITHQTQFTCSPICYAQRVIEQNTNKQDFYHGFTLVTTPFVLQYGEHTEWLNRRTNHKDDLISISGEIEYIKDTNTHVSFITIELCKGSDGVIYHRGMNSKESNRTHNEIGSYNANFPPLGTHIITPIYNNSESDEYDSYVIQETDYMVKIWDGGLNATITLYKP